MMSLQLLISLLILFQLIFQVCCYFTYLKIAPSSRLSKATTVDSIRNDMYFVDEEGSELSLNSFRNYVKDGLKKFLEGDIQGSVKELDRASLCNSSQPLQQRGIILYCVGRYDCAEKQLNDDIAKFESMRFSKASELRIWRSAALNKLNRREEAKQALDINNRIGISVITQSRFVNSTLSFFHGDLPLEEMISLTGNPSEKDLSGNNFFGNFFIGLYFDSIGEAALAEAFLAIPNQSTRYSDKDMW